MAESYTNVNDMMIRLKRTVLAAVLMLLPACTINQARDEDSAFYAVPPGSSIILNRDLTIGGDQVAVYLQGGDLMPYDEVNKYDPNCKFEIYTMSEQPRTVMRDTFDIIRVVDDIESSSRQRGIRLAMRGDTLMFGAADMSSVFNYATMLYLSSDSQKDVYRMTCQHWEDIRDDRYLTVTQMRTAMGEVFTLAINAD